MRWSPLGAPFCFTVIASAMILGVGTLQLERSYQAAMSAALGGVDARGRSVTRLTDASLRAVDLVVSGLAEDLTADEGKIDRSGVLEQRLQQLEQASDIVVLSKGRRWRADQKAKTPPGMEGGSLRWHEAHPADKIAHIETIFDTRSEDRVAIVLSKAIHGANGGITGVVAAVLRPSYFETLYGSMIIGANGAITLWRDDGYALLRYPPAPDSVGRNLSSATLTEAFEDPAPDVHRIHRSVLDGRDRLIGYRHLTHYPSLVVTTSSAIEDVVTPWLENELAQIAAVLLCMIVLFGMGVVTALHRRRQAEAARVHRSDEALFRGVFDHSTDSLFVFRRLEDGTFVIEAINPAAAKASGRPTADMVGRPAAQVLPARVAARLPADLDATIATGDVVRFENEGESEGRRSFKEVVQVPLTNADGMIDRVFVGARDITHLKTAEARLGELNQRLLLAEQMAHVGHWRLELPDNDLFWSDEVFRIHGLDPTMPMPDLAQAIAAYHPDDRVEVARLVNDAITLRQGFEFSLRIVRLDGEIRHVTSRCQLEVGKDANISAIFGTFMDVTDIKRAEKKLRSSEARFRLLAENTSELIQLGHDDGRRSYTSPAIMRLLGFSVAEFEAMRLRDYVHPDDLATLYATTRQLAQGNSEVSLSYRALHKTRGWIWVEGVFRKVEDAQGDDPTIVASFRDIGERREQAEALRRAKELAELAQGEAERASAAKTDFLASMSHEIRTPLGGVLGYTELLLDDTDLSDLQRRNVERIQNAGTALLTVVNDILDFSKIEAGQIDLELAPFRLDTLIDNSVSIVRSAADRKRLSLSVSIDPDIPPLLVGDQDRLRQVMLNLMNNAIKFTPAGRIGVDVRLTERTAKRLSVRFSVTDTGIGIPDDKREHLFKRFSQVDGSIARRFGGTGLGLAISKSLVTLMDGEIVAEPAIGGGSTFWFEVPLSEAADLGIGDEIAPLAGAEHSAKACILLVDDVEMNRDIGRAMIAGTGHSVDLACDGAEAIMAVQAKAYDLVLMDVQMPGMDGVTATGHIRSLAGDVRHVPIIAMTANVLPDQVARYRRAGMDDHVGKPIKRAALHAAIERSLAGTRRRPSAAAPQDQVLDTTVFDEMRNFLGEDAMRAMLTKFSRHLVEDLEQVLDEVCDPNGVARACHKVVATAGTMGFIALSKSCADLERVCNQGQVSNTPIERVREALKRTMDRIDMLQAA